MTTVLKNLDTPCHNYCKGYPMKRFFQTGWGKLAQLAQAADDGILRWDPCGWMAPRSHVGKWACALIMLAFVLYWVAWAISLAFAIFKFCWWAGVLFLLFLVFLSAAMRHCHG